MANPKFMYLHVASKFIHEKDFYSLMYIIVDAINLTGLHRPHSYSCVRFVLNNTGFLVPGRKDLSNACLLINMFPSIK